MTETVPHEPTREERVAAIVDKLAQIDATLRMRLEREGGNREKAIAQCRFIADTVGSIDPGKIESNWYGSYDNPGVGDYPNVTIVAMHSRL